MAAWKLFPCQMASISYRHIVKTKHSFAKDTAKNLWFSVFAIVKILRNTIYLHPPLFVWFIKHRFMFLRNGDSRKNIPHGNDKDYKPNLAM